MAAAPVLELPPGCSADNLERLADWVEASVLSGASEVSKYELMESLEAAGLGLPANETFGEDEDEFGTDPDESAANALERLADDILAQCSGRSVSFAAGYPFLLSTDLISLRDDVQHDSYAFLLVADLGHEYPELKYALTPDGTSGRLMEKVVEAALKGLFGHSQRFGWPREPGWPTDIDGRVQQLADQLGIEVDALEGKTDPSDKDRTLDVVALFRLHDPYEASLAVLVQCAAGENWKSKLGDPSVAAWHNLLKWNCQLIRAVAVPWRLGGRQNDWTYRRIYSMSNSAMVFDRPRLLAGHPDIHLDPAARPEVAEWWRSAVGKIPLAALRPPTSVGSVAVATNSG